MSKYSRSVLLQITSRVKRSEFTFDKSHKCFICGRTFLGKDCTHSYAENIEVIDFIKNLPV